jgi:hypothetical protein
VLMGVVKHTRPCFILHIAKPKASFKHATHRRCIPGARPMRDRIPKMAASLYTSGFSLRTFVVTILLSGFRATRSVKVPPRSIQISHFPPVESIRLF